MSPGQTSQGGDDLGFPRVSGDEPAFSGLQPVLETFSPRERG